MKVKLALNEPEIKKIIAQKCTDEQKLVKRRLRYVGSCLCIIIIVRLQQPIQLMDSTF